MKTTYNIYCDESCHLLNDGNKVFVLGAIWVNRDKVSEIFQQLRDLKIKHNLASKSETEIFEAKWTKISISKVNYYCDLIKYFFDNSDLHFRGVVVPNKEILNHAALGQDHDTWYYKMFYVLLNKIIGKDFEYNLYLDIKDTKSNSRVLNLQRLLNITDTEDMIAVQKAQQIRSHEVELIQLTDILIGALSYKHRGLEENEGKAKVIELIEKNVPGNQIIKTSEVTEEKFNILIWSPRK